MASLAALGLLGCAEETEAPVYQLVPVTTRDIVVSAQAAGTIEPVKTVDVKSKASGEIMDVRVETGDKVERGNLLVRVDPRVPSNAVIQAEADSVVARAQLENAESQLRRSEALFQSQSVTEQEYDNAKLARANAYAALIRAQRSLEDARIAFEDTEVRAATSGIILEKNVEVGTVIASASRDVGGGAILLRMANLDTVQIRTLVDETDIGKINPGLPVTITVDAYPNQPFRGRVLKIEPAALNQQNVTMFPVLVRIENEDNVLRPGMNAEVEISIGDRRGVLAVPNAALRTQRDIASAANVLGLDMEIVRQQLASSTETAEERGGRVTLGGNAANGEGAEGAPNIVTVRGREVELPAGLTREQVQPILTKSENEGMQSLSDAERAIMRQVFQSMGGRGGPGGQGGRMEAQPQSSFAYDGTYIVFAMRNGEPTATQIRTGLTDLDYSEVTSGLTAADSVLILPSASLIQSQQDLQERIGSRSGLPGLQRSNSSSRGR